MHCPSISIRKIAFQRAFIMPYISIHLIFKNGINNIFASQTSFLLVTKDTHAMPNRKTVESWGFHNLGYECNEFGEITVIFCEICHEYYSTNVISSSSPTLIKLQVDKFVSGTNLVKKGNFSDHIKKSVSHFNAVKGLNQTSIVTCVRGMSQKLKDQLVMKFQLAHFIAIHGKPFKLYSDFANFEEEFHNVDLGNCYLSDTSCHEMLTYLSRSIITNNITNYTIL